MAITKITADLLTTMRPELDAAVAEIGKKYGITLHFGNARYTELTATYTVNVGLAPSANFDPDKAQQPTPPAPTAEEKLRSAKMEWDLNCWRIGMKQEDFGKTVVLEGHLFRICGIRPRATVNSVLILDVKKNKEYVSSPEAIKKAWAGQQ